MAEPSTPVETTVQAGGEAPSQQTVENPTADQQQPSQPSQSQQPADQQQPNPDANAATQAPAPNDELSEWAKKQGFDPDNLSPDQSRQVLKRLRDTQKAFHESREALKAAQEFGKDINKNELAKLNEIDDPIERQTAVNTAELKNVRTSLAVERFFGANPDAIEHRQKMSELVAQDVEQYGDGMSDYWMANLDKLAQIAKDSTVESAQSAAYQQGRQEERENVARQQQFSTPQPHATNPTSGRQPITSAAQIRAMSEGERRERTDEIFAFFANQ